MKKTAFPIYSGQDRQIVGANYDKGKQIGNNTNWTGWVRQGTPDVLETDAVK